MKPVVSLPTWTKLMKQFRSFMRMHPWKYLEAQQFFGFCDPKTNRKYYCSVLGKENLITGFYIFPQDDSPFHFIDTFTNHQIDASLRQYTIAFVLGSQDHLFDEEYDLYQEQQFRFAKGKCFLFRFFEPGYAPFTINEEQAEVLLLGVEVVKSILKQREDNHDLQNLFERGFDDMEIPFFTCDSKKHWHYQAVPIDAMKQTRSPHVLSAADRDILAKQQNGTWEVGLLYFPTSVPSVHANRYIYPKVLIVADIEENRIITMLTKAEKQSDDVFISSLLDLLRKVPQIPSAIFMRGDDAEFLFDNFEEITGIEMINNHSEASLVDRIWTGFVEFSQKEQYFSA